MADDTTEIAELPRHLRWGGGRENNPQRTGIACFVKCHQPGLDLIFHLPDLGAGLGGVLLPGSDRLFDPSQFTLQVLVSPAHALQLCANRAQVAAQLTLGLRFLLKRLARLPQAALYLLQFPTAVVEVVCQRAGNRQQ